MIAASLSGIGVLVTRPRELAEPLCRGIVKKGGTAIPWPAVDIRPQTVAADALASLRKAGTEAVVIFVSRNAVTHGAACLLREPRPVIAAIGPSTAAALTALGLEPDIVPDGHDSESLLADPRLSGMRGRSVFIARGVGGRELLGRGLRDRGAEVEYLEVYRRERVANTPEQVSILLRRWRAGNINIYTATSLAIFENLRADLGPEGAALMTATALVTASRRVVKRAQEAGHDGPLLLAPGPDDASLLETIANWSAAIGPPSSATDPNNE